jgi:hypothetical protein
MIVDMNNAKKVILEKKQDREAREQLSNDIDGLEAESVVLGAIIATTGLSVIGGVDYTLQKNRLLEEARKATIISDEISDVLHVPDN